MLSHEGVWAAIDSLAEKKRLTPSGLARAAGLDPTSFNKSKRVTGVGRPRWPSTESVARVLRATDTSLEEFMALIPGFRGAAKAARKNTLRAVPDKYGTPGELQVPLIGFAQAGVGGFFDDGGFPAGQGWDEINFPNGDQDAVYALEVSGDSMLPLYRDGDIIIVAPGATIRKGDRVVVRTLDGEVMAKLLARRSTKAIELQSLNPEHPDRAFKPEEIDWMARIIWASQ
ncbi:MAG: helix-turn-helix transcriptional regulator [Salaquimonas sp.]|jgi:phage repressor protein C with HTH and peptisase S24 domain|nr:helix-turn-helix transcriptional regulator [Salaquimonas sp.]